MPESPSYPELVALLDELYGDVTAAVEPLDTAGFLLPTRARAWCVQDLVLHQLLDAQRALTAFASPGTVNPDVDAVTYWRPFRPDAGDGGVAHARFVRIASSAYAEPGALVSHWRSTAEATVRAAAATEPSGSVSTQGHVLRVPDFVHTLVVEATVHLLDLGLAIEVPGPPPDALRLVRAVLDGLLGEPVAADWDDVQYTLKGTGRVALDGTELVALGEQAARFPLLG